MSGEITLRTLGERAQPAQPVEEFTRNTRRIKFRHPGYEHEGNMLIALSAFDNGGLHYRTALFACAIVAGNRFDGYFKTDIDGDRLDEDFDTILTAKSYYFFVPLPAGTGDVWQYPTSPSFQHWKFPDNLPSGWITRTGNLDDERLSAPAVSNFMRSQPCIMTRFRDSVQAAHIVPRSESNWFHKNNMSDYNLNDDLVGTAMDDLSNMLSLRADVYIAFDSKKFVFTPKKLHWVVHFLNHTHDLGSLYHNTAVEIGQEVSPEFLLARFAWAIFPAANAALSPTFPRNMILLEGSGKVTTKTLTYDDLLSSDQGMMTRKRKRATEVAEAGPSGVNEMLRLHETAMSFGGSEYESRVSSSRNLLRQMLSKEGPG